MNAWLTYFKGISGRLSDAAPTDLQDYLTGSLVWKHMQFPLAMEICLNFAHGHQLWNVTYSDL